MDRRSAVAGWFGVVAISVLSACGGGSGSDATATTAAPAADATDATEVTDTTSGSATTAGSDITPGDPAATAFVDIQVCEASGGTGTASGTITNTGDAPVAFRLVIGFLDGSGTVVGAGTVETGTVDAGAETAWSATVDGVSDEPDCRTQSVVAVGGDASPSTNPMPVAEEFPCTLIPPAAIEEVAGNPLPLVDASTTIHDEESNGTSSTWTAKQCSWSSTAGVQPATELRLEVTVPGGFPSGRVECPPWGGDVQPVGGIGNSATWAWQDAGTDLHVGDLRVCTQAAMLDVNVSGAGDEATLRQAAFDVATMALAGL